MITDINKIYLERNELKVNLFGRGTIWLDTGTFDSLFEASTFVKSIETKQSYKIGSPEEISWRNGWITDEQLLKIAKTYGKNEYNSFSLSLSLYIYI